MQAILITHRDEYESITPLPPIGSVGEVLAGPDSDGDFDILFEGWPCLVGEPSWVIHKNMLVFIDDTLPQQKAADKAVSMY